MTTTTMVVMLQEVRSGRLDSAFFDRSALEVAPALLGKLLVRELDEGNGSARLIAGRIVETEAYMQDDPAFHAWGIVDVPTGLVKPSGRGYALFAPPGTAYVYLCYGVHWLLNVVTEREGIAGCVLIRALEPVAGHEHMTQRRPAARTRIDLCNGPGKLTQAFAISGVHHQTNLCTGPIYFSASGCEDPVDMATSARIGISRAIERPWRFFERDSAFVSPGIPSDIAAAKRRKRRNDRRLRTKLGG